MTPVEEIKERLNIVDVVGEYVQLKKTGANHKGLCPFHNETTPSFSVSETKQFYYCFGCGKGGDMFSFVEEVEGMEFAEVLRALAVKANVELKAVNPKDQNEKTRLIDCNTAAAQFFVATLRQADAAEVARSYIAGRALKDETVQAFRLGYAPDSWDKLINFLKGKKFTPQEIEQAGLVVRSEKNNSVYDRFRGRLMFPIHNAHGNVIGFTARTLKADEKGAKYINTPQTKVYNKSAAIYGLHLAKKAIQRADAVVLVEGNMDVVKAHQAGFTNVVASSGTALTDTQVRLLKRYTSNVILAFDGDAAGVRAAWRGMEIAIKQGMNIKVLQLPEGQDPDDVITTDPAAFKQLASEARPFMDFAFEHILSSLDMNQVADKKQAASELLPMIALFPDQIEQTHYLQRLADTVQVDMHVLQEKLQPFASGGQSRPAQQQPAQPQAPERNSLHHMMHERLLALLLTHPSLMSRGDDLSFEEPHAGLYKKMLTQYNQSDSSNDDIELSFDFDDPQDNNLYQRLSLIAQEMYGRITLEDATKEYDTLRDRFFRDTITTRLQAIQHELKTAEQQNDTDAIERLSKEFHELTLKRRDLG